MIMCTDKGSEVLFSEKNARFVVFAQFLELYVEISLYIVTPLIHRLFIDIQTDIWYNLL